MTPLPRMMVLTDRSQLPMGRSLREVMAQCADVGLTHVVLREFDLDVESRAALADDLTRLGLSVIAAHRPLPTCTGVHLPSGQSVPEPASAWGRSCHSASEVRQAAGQGAQWATLSPYSWTTSKPGYGPPLRADAFADHEVPVYALGGINVSNAVTVREVGAHGVAVMGAVMRADEPSTVVASILRDVAA